MMGIQVQQRLASAHAEKDDADADIEALEQKMVLPSGRAHRSCLMHMLACVGGTTGRQQWLEGCSARSWQVVHRQLLTSGIT